MVPWQSERHQEGEIHGECEGFDGTEWLTELLGHVRQPIINLRIQSLDHINMIMHSRQDGRS